MSVRYVTYGTLDDMLNDTNRTANFAPNSFGVGRNVVGSGAFFVPDILAVPAPAAVWMFMTALGWLGLFDWRRRRATS